MIFEKEKYTFKEISYDEYIRINGEKSINTPAAIELKNSNAKAYAILENAKIISDFVIYFKEENLCTIRTSFAFKNCLKETFNYLKSIGYEYLTDTIILGKNESAINIYKENCEIIELNTFEEKINNEVYKIKRIKLILK